MLPHFPGIKTALFTKRILLINQTIAPLGGKGTENEKHFAFLWHEGIQGRNDEDVESAVVKFLNLDTLCQNFTLWCDNCSGQNKNWTLFGALAHYLNKPSVSLHSITLKFFEKGHTFMSADSYHHLVEEEIRKKKRLYNQDFVDCANKRGVAVQMVPEDFFDYKKEKGCGKDIKCPYISDISVVQFRRGSTKLFWKSSFLEVDFLGSEFLELKTRKRWMTWNLCPSKGKPRGITLSKKVEILRKLSIFMKSDRIKFWEDIPANELSKDLTVNIEHISKK